MDVTSFIVSLFLFPDLSQQTECPEGWFGSGCMYMCHCTNDKCDENGTCIGKERCVGGWFGPACQYVDLAYNMTSSAEITDGKDETCIYAKNMNSVRIALNQTFSWLRIRGVVNDLRVKLRQQGYTNLCRDSRNATVDEKTLDIYCPSNGTVNEVLIAWFEASQLCSIYISGGRNVALKQNATESSMFVEEAYDGHIGNVSYPAYLAVDGTIDQFFNLGRACSMTHHDSVDKGGLNISLSQPRVVNRFVMTMGLGEFGLNAYGVNLELLNEAGTQVYSFRRVLKITQLQYMDNFVDIRVVLAKITTNRQDNVLNVCEFELFGDSACPSGRFGRECEKTCHCLKHEDCFVSTGGCPSGCAHGYTGIDCNAPCKAGTYGLNCQNSCSLFCETHITGKVECDPVTGACLRGCVAGFQAPACVLVCETNKYGPGCQSVCSQNCGKRINTTDPLCDGFEGICFSGCNKGYQGPKCNASCDEDKYGINCKESCSRECLPSKDSNGSSCHHITGTCLIGCSPDYTGTKCDRKFVLLQSSTPSQFTPRRVVIVVMSTLGAACILVTIYVLICVKKDRHLSTDEMNTLGESRTLQSTSALFHLLLMSWQDYAQ